MSRSGEAPSPHREPESDYLSMVTERRQSPRSKPFGLIYLNLASDNGGIVLDASEDGLQFQAVAPVTQDDGPMPLWFTLNPTSRIETVGEIVWTDETRKTGGLRFTNLLEETRLQIRSWLEQNGTPLPVREYASPIDLALSESTFAEEAEQQQYIETIRKPRATEIEEVLNSVESEIAPPATPAATIVPRYPDKAPLYPEPRPEFKESDAPAVSPREVIRPVESAPAMPQRMPRVIDPRPTVTRRDIPRDTPREAARQAAGETPAISIRETAQPAAPAPVIPQRVPAQPYQSIIEPSYVAPAPAPVYSGRESEDVLREVAAAAQHRLDDPAPFYSPSFSNFPAPTPRARVSEPPPLIQPFAGVSTRASDYATPWRPTFSSGASRYRGERVSRLAEMLYRMGVPSDLVRDVEIMIVVVSLVVAGAVILVVFHRQVGEGVQWLGQNLSSKSSETVEKPVGIASEPVPSPDSTLSPLLQPPAGSQSSTPAATVKRKPKPPVVVVEGGMGAPTIYAADPNATPALPNDTGEAELANALPYLRGDSGSTETNVGVKWLWASVEKGNTKAAIILADLYIWGRGVPQNCEQARVLLTAAVKRGSAEAAQRLQDMGADGCVSAVTPVQ